MAREIAFERFGAFDSSPSGLETRAENRGLSSASSRRYLGEVRQIVAAEDRGEARREATGPTNPGSGNSTTISQLLFEAQNSLCEDVSVRLARLRRLILS
jgi:hypothetical protein